MKKAVVLLSGGLDSATCLAMAKTEFECYTLSFDYGQRHRCELAAADKISRALGAKRHIVIDINLRAWGGSALTDDKIDVPAGSLHSDKIPATYVPARNLIFLSFATAWSEVLGARDIFIGVNSMDYSNYPDCRGEFIRAFTEAARLGTKAADEKWAFTINAPLQNLTKSEIIRRGIALGVDYSLTTSCYNPSPAGLSCGKCDSCLLRAAGFAEAGVKDPTHYVQ